MTVIIFYSITSSIFESDINTIQSSLLTSSSIIIPIFFSYVLMKYSTVSKLRFEKLQQYIEYQSKILPLLEKFRSFAGCFKKTYGITISDNRKYDELWSDPEFRCNMEIMPFSQILYKSSLFLAGNLINYCTDILELLKENSNKEKIPKDVLLAKKECLDFLFYHAFSTGYLTELFKELKIPEHQSEQSNNVFILRECPEYGPDFVYSHIIDEDFRKVEYWENQIGICLDIVEKMNHLLPFLDDYDSKTIKQMTLTLSIMALFGIVLPLILISVSLGIMLEQIITLFSVAIVIIGIGYLIWGFYKEITTKRIYFQ